MAKLSTAERKALPSKEFAGPGRSFPIPDPTHAEKAIQLAPRAEHAGHISASQEHAIVAKARAKLKGFHGHGLQHQMHRRNHGG